MLPVEENRVEEGSREGRARRGKRKRERERERESQFSCSEVSHSSDKKKLTKKINFAKKSHSKVNDIG